MTGPTRVTRYDQIITCGQTLKNVYNTMDVPSPPVPEEMVLSPVYAATILISRHSPRQSQRSVRWAGSMVKIIPTKRHSPRQGQRSARRGSLAVDSPIIAGIERTTGGPETRCEVRRRSEPHRRSCSAATQGAEIVELPVGRPHAFLRIPSSPSS